MQLQTLRHTGQTFKKASSGIPGYLHRGQIENINDERQELSLQIDMCSWKKYEVIGTLITHITYCI